MATDCQGHLYIGGNCNNLFAVVYICTMAAVLDRSIFTDSHAKSILSTMNNLRKSNTLCDVTLYVDGCQFPVHRIVLAACSDYFCAMFTHQVLSSGYIAFIADNNVCCLLFQCFLSS